MIKVPLLGISYCRFLKYSNLPTCVGELDLPVACDEDLFLECVRELLSAELADGHRNTSLDDLAKSLSESRHTRR